MDKLKQSIQADADALRINFDDAVAEEKAKAIIVEFDGKEYALPSKPPAWLPLFIASRQKDGFLKDADNMELVEGLLGKEFVSRIVDTRDNFVSLEKVNDAIIEPVMKHWGLEITSADKKK